MNEIACQHWDVHYLDDDIHGNERPIALISTYSDCKTLSKLPSL